MILNILLVDDELEILNGLALAIEKLGSDYRVVGAISDPTTALESIAYLKPDLVLLDIKMPQLSGLELSGLIKKKYPEISIVFLTGYASFSFAQQAIKMGVLDYLLKPVKRAELLAVLQHASHRVDQDEEHYQELLYCQGDTLYCHERLQSVYHPKSFVSSTNIKPVVRRTIQYINEHYAEDVSLANVANHLFVNTSYLSDAFKQDVGISFSSYATYVRMEHARYFILKNPSFKVYEVAQLVGYNDPRYFSQVFKKYFRVNPPEYLAHTDR